MATGQTLIGKDLYNELNKQEGGIKVIPGLKEKILLGISSAMRMMQQVYFDAVPDEKIVNGQKVPNAEKMNRWTEDIKCLEFHEGSLNAGIYAISQVKKYLREFEEMQKLGLPNYYSNKPLVGHLPLNEKTWRSFSQKPNPIKMEMFKNPNVFEVKIRSLYILTVGFEKVAWIWLTCLSQHGVWINAGHHMASVNQILTLASLFEYRFKEIWYQDAGVNLKKNVSKDDRKDSGNFQKLSSYGLSRNFYHHLRMLNYPKEIKARLRRMTGVGTDIIDYINICRSGVDTFGEKTKIKNALKKKCAFWMSKTIIEDFLKYLEDNKKDQGNLTTAVTLFMGAVNALMPSVEHKIVPHPIFYTLLYDNKMEKTFDFSAQGAYKAYNFLRNKLATMRAMTLRSTNTGEYRYAYLLATFDLLQADQNMIHILFGDSIQLKTRSDFVSKIKHGDRAVVTLDLPELKKWSKMYNGERGSTGEEQKSVTMTFAGITHYNGDDFILSKPDDVIASENAIAGMQIVQRLQAEVRKQYTLRHQKSITYGTQKWYNLSDLGKTNEELQLVKGMEMQVSKIIPFFGTVGDKRGSASIVGGREQEKIAETNKRLRTDGPSTSEEQMEI